MPVKHRCQFFVDKKILFAYVLVRFRWRYGRFLLRIPSCIPRAMLRALTFSGDISNGAPQYRSRSTVNMEICGHRTIATDDRLFVPDSEKEQKKPASESGLKNQALHSLCLAFIIVASRFLL